MALERKSLNIMLVEDNPGDILLLEEAFQIAELSANWIIAQDGEEAVAMLHQAGRFQEIPRPDLVLLDLNLPRLDGRYVLGQIKSQTKFRQIPVFVLSTSTRQEDIDEAYALHANCYVPKPMELQRLIDLGREIHSFWLNTVRLPAGREQTLLSPLPHSSKRASVMH